MAQGDFRQEIVDGEEQTLNCSRLKHLLELEELCNAPVMQIVARLKANTWGVRDVREPIRLGLIGGGMDEGKASVLATRLTERSLGGYFSAAPLALLIVGNGLSGVREDQPPGKPAADQGTEAASE